MLSDHEIDSGIGLELDVDIDIDRDIVQSAQEQSTIVTGACLISPMLHDKRTNLYL